MKICSKCREKKSELEFNRRAKSADGLRATCKACDQATREAWKAKQTPSSSLGSGGGGAPGEAPGPTPDPSKVVGRIGPEGRVKEVYTDPVEEAEAAAAEEYAALLNKSLPVKKRAALMVKIAKNIQGGNAALALKAIDDINVATKVVSKKGVQLDFGPMFVVEGDKDIAVK